MFYVRKCVVVSPAPLYAWIARFFDETSKSRNFLGTCRLASVDMFSVLCTSNEQDSLQIFSLIWYRRDTVKANQCGKKCDGPLVETKEDTRGLTCNTPVPCEFTPWTRWSHCHSHLSQRTRFRHSSRPSNNGTACEGALTETEPCGAMPDIPKDCSLSHWGSWIEGSTCPTALRYKSRCLQRSPMCHDCDLQMLSLDLSRNTHQQTSVSLSCWHLEGKDFDLYFNNNDSVHDVVSSVMDVWLERRRPCKWYCSRGNFSGLWFVLKSDSLKEEIGISERRFYCSDIIA